MLTRITQHNATHDQLRARFSAADGTGAYKVLFIHAGEANGWSFSAQVLRESAPLWDNASVFVDHAPLGRSVRDLAGVLGRAQWDEALGGLTAELTPTGPSREILGEAARAMLGDGPTPDIGFSADVIFTADADRRVTRIVQPVSVDLVMDPAFATRFIRTINQRRSRVEGEKTETNGDEIRHLERTMGEVLLEGALGKADLPEPAQKAIRESFRGRRVTMRAVNDAVQAWKDSVAEGTAPGEIVGPARVSGMFTSDDMLQAAVDDLVGAPREPGAENLQVARFSGLKQAYVQLTGDSGLTGGYFGERAQFQHTTANFPGLVRNALNKSLAQHWSALGQAGYDWWQKIVRVEHFESLNDITWLLMGSVASLPTVAEGAEYTELKIGDSAETSSFVKKGGYIGLTLEAIDRDDGRRLRAIPRELAFAGLREISALVAAVFTANSGTGPVMGDGGALFNNTTQTTKGGHKNLLTTALGTDFTAWDSAASAMYAQPMLVAGEDGYYGAGKVMAVEPRFCLVPRALKAQAEALFIPRWASTVDAAIAAKGGPSYAGYVQPVTVPEWTDATKWAAVADPAILPGIMLGERFGLMPQIFVAGSETDPAMFANDEQRLKVRHFIAVGVADYRALVKSNA